MWPVWLTIAIWSCEAAARAARSSGATLGAAVATARRWAWLRYRKLCYGIYIWWWTNR